MALERSICRDESGQPVGGVCFLGTAGHTVTQVTVELIEFAEETLRRCPRSTEGETE